MSLSRSVKNKTLFLVRDIFGPNHEIFVARELTKIYETIYKDNVLSIIDRLESYPKEQKGEFVIILTSPAKEVEEKEAAAKQSDSVVRKIASRQKGRSLESSLDHQFASGRVYAKITSRPGQSGRCDGIVLEGPELVFYQKMMAKK